MSPDHFPQGDAAAAAPSSIDLIPILQFKAAFALPTILLWACRFFRSPIFFPFSSRFLGTGIIVMFGFGSNLCFATIFAPVKAIERNATVPTIFGRAGAAAARNIDVFSSVGACRCELGHQAAEINCLT
jgi:hypothetical protein